MHSSNRNSFKITSRNTSIKVKIMDFYDEEVSDAAVMPRGNRIPRVPIIANHTQPTTYSNIDAQWEEEFKLSEPLNLDKEEESYPGQRYKVMIFNNFKFFEGLELDERSGSIIDRDDLEKKFSALSSDIKTHMHSEGDFTKEKLFNTIEEEDLKGSKEDMDDLKNKLPEIRYDIQTHKEELEGDLTKDKLFNTIEEVVREHEKFDAFILVIMTHGNLKELAAHDQMYKITDLLDLFKSKMNDKPKLIVLNACRGQQNYHSFQKQKSGFFSDLSVNNCMVVYTAYPGFLGYRKVDKGSRLIRSLRKALQALADQKKQRLLIDLFTDIKRHVSTNPNPNNPQMPIVQHNLEKRFFIG
ncbi:uncharacterized protein LOC143910561 [Arctopsyche grandis]|uniref:uncharacterized protein LOC143910561 n=1 Tax=Arctopsyche grandis TaxID=121162 RepID=UPI00406D6B9B